MVNESKYDSLIKELKVNRDSLREDVLPKIILFRTKLEALLPGSNDFKHRYLLEQKMKTVTEIVNSELSIRKQIDDSIKTEFDLVRKSSGEDVSEISIAKLAEAMESLNVDKKEESELVDIHGKIKIAN